MDQPGIDQQAVPAELLGDLPSESASQVPENTIESFDDNGVLTQRATYVDGVLEGEFLVFNPQGVVIKKFLYQQGKLHGEALIYNDDGQLIQRLSYDEGVLDGPFQTFVNDVMLLEVPYVKGAREGIGRVFAPNGRIQLEMTFQGDKENGARTIYNPELGVIVRTETLADGVVDGQSLTFYPGGTVMMQQSFEKGLPEGRSISFYENGTIQQVADYEKGVLKNPPQQFDLTGKEI